MPDFSRRCNPVCLPAYRRADGKIIPKLGCGFYVVEFRTSNTPEPGRYPTMVAIAWDEGDILRR